MENEEITRDQKSYNERFVDWKNFYLKCCPSIPREHRICVDRWSVIFNKVPEGSYLKSALYDMLSTYLAGAWGVSVYLEKLSEILPVVERLISNNSFEDALDFAALFLEITTADSRSQNNHEHFLQTRNARYVRSSKNAPLFRALWYYLITAYYKWRPAPEEGKPNRQRAVLNKTLAAKSVFNAHTEKIKEILDAQGHNHSKDSEYSSEFETIFEAFVKKIKDNPELREKFSYIPEKRAPRSQASRQRSRQSALKKHTK